jgi:hypothetical protein
MKILLATPAHGGMVCLGYHETIVQTLAFFRENFPGIQFENRSIVCSCLPFARNVFASMVLNDPSFSHLLFIDSDMGFSPSLLAKMIAFQKPVVGCVSPKKVFNYDWFHASHVRYQDPMLARLLANDYIGGQGALITTTTENGERKAELVDGFVRVNYAGTGIMLVHRDVFEKLKQQFPELWVEKTTELYWQFGLRGGVLQCFDSFQGADGLFPGEDIAFCRRWVDGCGGEIWSCVDEVIAHIGQENYIGQYLVKLENGESLFSHPLEASPASPVRMETSHDVAQHERALRRAG